MIQSLVWVPGSPSTVNIDRDDRPFRVWTVYSATDPNAPPQLPLTPTHNQGFFLEDHVHDWVMRGGRKLKFFSRVVDRDEGCWLLLEWKEPASSNPPPPA